MKQFEGIGDPELYNHSLQVSTYGVTPCGDRVPDRFAQPAYDNVNGDPQAAAFELREDAMKGRLLLFTERSEPYDGDLMGPKLAYVTQRDVANPENT